MTQSYATNFFPQQEFQERFKFYFKQAEYKAQPMLKRDQLLHDLVRPRLKIAIVTESWPLELAANSCSLLQLCRGLQYLGHKVLLIKPQQKQDHGHFNAYKECLVKLEGCSQSRRLKLDGSQHLKMSTALADFLPHMIYIATEGPLGLAALQIAKVMHIPISSGFHSPFSTFSRFFDLAFLIKPIQRYLQWFYNSTQLTCVPSLEIEQALKKFGVTCPLQVVDPGVDLTLFHRQSRSTALRKQWSVKPDDIVLLYEEDLSPSHTILIALYQKMLQQGQSVKLVVIGERVNFPFLSYLEQQMHIFFTGQLKTTASLAQVYASADILLYLKPMTELNHRLAQAMASGLAIAYHQVENLSPQQQWLLSLDELVYQLPVYTRLRHMGEYARQNIEQCGWLYSIQQFERIFYQLIAHQKN
ncbi:MULTISPECIES: glycosyltransferase [unclassified Acinetobacter]|uniref:glycosyltransferase n=1 Tax=unclassified Acinetobacter TaxID=196816 RepID=UPI0029340FDA|nr:MULTISPECIES: glycosyltransferase [unclassified Acinetobacter]WOE30432.1 glycosyltransferase [Acinetobacter sp. SAAs470]WOE38623.1 glycosyltransferase [Acinetobacter sp. SAAs474]